MGIIEPTAVYLIWWGVPFPIPVCPPAYPAIPNDATAIVHVRSEAEHTIIVKDFAADEATTECAVAPYMRFGSETFVMPSPTASE